MGIIYTLKTTGQKTAPQSTPCSSVLCVQLQYRELKMFVFVIVYIFLHFVKMRDKLRTGSAYFSKVRSYC